MNAHRTHALERAAATGASDHEAERPLIVCIRPYQLNFWEYEGTRAQLEAEGVIPSDTKWPEGSREVCWKDGRFRWGLRRTRPEGLKGPMKLWVSGDWWALRCDLLNPPDHGQLRILDKKRELDAEIRRWSRAGKVECDAYGRSLRDKAFQSFKAKIPGLIPPKRGRKPNAGLPRA